MRLLDFKQFSPFHMRITDGGYTILDVWTTGKYYIVRSNYHQMLDTPIVERGGEKGRLGTTEYAIYKHLDGIFYPENNPVDK